MGLSVPATRHQAGKIQACRISLKLKGTASCLLCRGVVSSERWSVSCSTELCRWQSNMGLFEIGTSSVVHQLCCICHFGSIPHFQRWDTHSKFPFLTWGTHWICGCLAIFRRWSVSRPARRMWLDYSGAKHQGSGYCYHPPYPSFIQIVGGCCRIYFLMNRLWDDPAF